ncbi:MAG TPA: SMP-30/gluconolactonase/LRE family protein [Vicinamibacterales bacterium]|nr:SMP-30/gluconolactonase/LRE family protein [Vicinamibacterales bacterium]
MAEARPELVLDARATLGEGPVWDDRRQRLVWVDILERRVHRFDPASGRCESRTVPRPVGAAALAEDGSLLLAVQGGFAWLDFDADRYALVAEVEADRPDLRMNDGACDPAGRFWAGSMAFDERPGAGALYRVDPAPADGPAPFGARVTQVLRDVTVSNGIDWSSDRRRMYYVDSGTRRVDVFDFDVEHGTIANRRPLVEIEREAGVPDGLTVDAEDHVWVALWGGGAVRRYAPDGRLDRAIPLPVTHPTSCAFGGPDLADLFVTSATVALAPADRARQPGAGGIYRLRPGVAGRPPYRWGRRPA